MASCLWVSIQLFWVISGVPEDNCMNMWLTASNMCAAQVQKSQLQALASGESLIEVIGSDQVQRDIIQSRWWPLSLESIPYTATTSQCKCYDTNQEPYPNLHIRQVMHFGKWLCACVLTCSFFQHLLSYWNLQLDSSHGGPSPLTARLWPVQSLQSSGFLGSSVAQALVLQFMHVVQATNLGNTWTPGSMMCFLALCGS